MLPKVIPYMAIPTNNRNIYHYLQFFTLNLFQFVSLGCISSHFNFYYVLLGSTILPALSALFFFLIGKFWSDEGVSRRNFYSAALAVFYFELPTITLAIDNVIPCDEVTGSGLLLKADYSISCEDTKYKLFRFYGGCMLLLFPIGIPAFFCYFAI